MSAQDVWEERRLTEKTKSPYVSRIVEYKPAPGQFINEEGTGTPDAAQTIVGGIQGLVSLGGFGGYIIAGFDHTIWNDPGNPYGVDFTVVGNAAANSSEPGIVMVMADTNGNGIPDDTWYELKGSNYAQSVRNYTITYTNPGTDHAEDVPWTDSKGQKGTLNAVASHQQPYYPFAGLFPGYPQDQVSFTGSAVELDIDSENQQYIKIEPLPYGYADNLPFVHGKPPYRPDNPETTGQLEGNGGNAFDIDWAVDADGNQVYLEGIDFIKIYTAINRNAGWLGEISTEVCGIIDVSPDDITSAPVNDRADIRIFPNPVVHSLNIQSARDIDRIDIWDAAGVLTYTDTQKGNEFLIPVDHYLPGIYFIRLTIGKTQVMDKILKN